MYIQEVLKAIGAAYCGAFLLHGTILHILLVNVMEELTQALSDEERRRICILLLKEMGM